MQIQDLTAGQVFTMDLVTPRGRFAGPAYKMLEDDRIERQLDGDFRKWTLEDCGYTPETEITGVVYGA